MVYHYANKTVITVIHSIVLGCCISINVLMNFHLSASLSIISLGTFRSDYDNEYKYDLWAREACVLAVVDTVVAVFSWQQKYFSNFCEYEVVDKQHKMPQRRQNIARKVAWNISQCISAFKDLPLNSPLHLQWTRSRGTRFFRNLVVRVKTATRFWRQNELTRRPHAIAHAHWLHIEKLVLVVVVVVGSEGPYCE